MKDKIKSFFQFLSALILFIPSALLVTVIYLIFYFFIYLPEMWRDEKDERADHNYIDHFDK